MTPVLSPGEALRAMGGLLYILVGLVVLRLGPRRPVNIAFAAYAVALGVLEALAIGVVIDAVGQPNRDALAVHLLLALNLAAFALALVYPRRLPRSQWRRALVPPALLGLASLAMQHWSGIPWDGQGAHPYLVALLVVSVAVPSLHFLLPSRFAADAGVDPDSPQLAWLAALFLIPSFIGTGAILAFMAQEATPLWPNFGFIALGNGMVVVLWLWASACAATPGAARLARNVALFACSVMLATMGILVALPSLSVDAIGGVLGIARILFVLALAYAVLRHQVLGLDVKVRWGVSRGTIAAAFVAVFFVASEGAQILFGQGNEWLGLLAAGALVFAVAPLQRVAERFAAQVVPPNFTPNVDSGGVSQKKDEAYRVAVRLALRDGVLGRQEERQLLRLADELGISPGRAGEIHEDEENRGGTSP